MQHQAKALSIGDMARALGVNRVTIDRAIASGSIVPSFRTPSGRARFEPAYVDEMQRRAAEARARGVTNVLWSITPHPDRPKPQMSPARFAAWTAWKRTVLKRKPAR